jgi:hypothetical protein
MAALQDPAAAQVALAILGKAGVEMFNAARQEALREERKKRIRGDM